VGEHEVVDGRTSEHGAGLGDRPAQHRRQCLLHTQHRGAQQQGTLVYPAFGVRFESRRIQRCLALRLGADEDSASVGVDRAGHQWAAVDVDHLRVLLVDGNGNTCR